jgi:hypothetical protein
MSHILTVLIFAFASLQSHALDGNFHVQARGTETWVQLKFNPVVSSVMADILFVVDDSGSMTPFQANLSDNVDAFLNAVPQSQLQVGVITTTATTNTYLPYKPGQLVNGIHKSSDPQFVNKLKKSLLVGTQGDGTERPFETLSLALSEPLLSTVNAGFLRPNADLYIVFITDTQDQSSIDTNVLFAQIKALKPQQTVTTLAAMASPIKGVCQGEQFDLEQSTKIQDFVSLTGGSVFSICDDFAKSIVAAINVSVMTENTLVLEGTESLKTPVFSSILVEVDGLSYLPGDIATSWTYSSKNKTITFSDWIISQSVAKGPILVTYKVQ